MVLPPDRRSNLRCAVRRRTRRRDSRLRYEEAEGQPRGLRTGRITWTEDGPRRLPRCPCGNQTGERAMTHSGGKPHPVGDKGQRYEVTVFDTGKNERIVVGWTNDAATARSMAGGAEL